MTDKDTSKDTKQKTSGKLGTLSVVGTLGVSSTPRSSSKSGVTVEVKKKRFSTTPSTAKSAHMAPEDSEMSHRMKVLEEAEKNATLEEEKRKAERDQSRSLAEMKAQEVEEKKARQEALEKTQREAEDQKTASKEDVVEEKAQVEAIVEQQVQEQKAQKDTRHGHDRKPSDGYGQAKKSAKPRVDKDSSKKRGGRNAYLEQLEQRYRTMGASRRKQTKQNATQIEQEKVQREVTIPEVITVQELAARMSEKVGDVIKKLMMMGQMVTQNQSIDQETSALIVEEMGHTYVFTTESDIEEGLMQEDEDDSLLVERPPVVTVMGHVDHGKTSLLDALRKTDVAEGEAGGITQHIGAYQIKTEAGRKITFLDTPGHEAFTSMRARGASLTDIVILVVAADDGIMPQTVEAIRHAKAAEVPIIVAVNKCDKPEANPERVKQELLSHDLIPEEFGGDIVCVNISAKAGTGLKELEELILLQADVLELTANTHSRASGAVVESRLDKGLGPVATIIVEKGTLKIGDIFVVGSVWGRVRSLMDDKGKRITEAGPSFPVEVQGLQAVAEAGDVFTVAENERKAREIAAFRERKKREKAQAAASGRLSLDNLFNRIADGSVAKLNIVVKADVQGSVEAIQDTLAKLETSEVKVQVIHGAVGVITENDVNLAAASDALIIGFNVRANMQARKASEAEGIELRYYSVIYNLVDDVKAALTGMITSSYKENIIGRAQIREVFKINKSKIAGCYVTEGKILRNGQVRLVRDGVVVFDGKLAGLQRFKDEAKEVAENFECGMTFERFDDIQANDEIECYEMVEVKRTLEDVKRDAAVKEAAAKAAKEEAELQAMMEAEEAAE